MRRTHWLIFLIGFTAITLWAVRPMPLHPDAVVVGPPGDNLFFVWLVDWYRYALSGGHLPLDVPRLNAPEGWHLAFNEMTPSMTLAGLPGYLLGGPALAYNLTFVLSFVLTGCVACYWVTRLTGRLSIGAVAAVALAFAPYRMSHAIGHLNLMGTQWLVLYLCCLTIWLHEGGRRWAVGAGLALVLVAGTSQYYLFMSGLMSIVLAAVVLRSRPGWYRDPDVLNDIGAAATVTLPLLALLVAPYLELARQGFLPPRTYAQVEMWSASVTDFLLPSPLHWALGDWVNAHFDRSLWVENTISIGLVMPCLAVVGWWTARRTERRRLTDALALAAVVAAVLALGMELRWLGRVVEVPVPGWLVPWVGGPRSSIPLPGAWLFWNFPYYSSMRVWMRWGYFVTVLLAPLAGLGLAHLMQGRSRRVATAIVVCVGLAVAAEVAQKPYPVVPIGPRPVDTWLADQPGDGLVVQLPASELGEPGQTLQTAFHGKPFAGAFLGAFLTTQYRRYAPRLGSFPSEDAVSALRELGAEWVLVDLSRYPDADQLRRETDALGMRAVTVQGDQLVLRVR